MPGLVDQVLVRKIHIDDVPVPEQTQQSHRGIRPRNAVVPIILTEIRLTHVAQTDMTVACWLKLTDDALHPGTAAVVQGWILEPARILSLFQPGRSLDLPAGTNDIRTQAAEQAGQLLIESGRIIFGQNSRNEFQQLSIPIQLTGPAVEILGGGPDLRKQIQVSYLI